MKLKSQNIDRNSNFEILRIIAMLLIVSYHFVFHLNIDINKIIFFPNKLIVNLFMFNGKLGVNIFMLISGYFLIHSKFNLKKAIRLYINTTIISIIIVLILSVFNFPLQMVDYIKSFFPIFFNVYWFITSYFIIYIFTDYINKFINSLTKKEYFCLLILLGVLLALLPSLFSIKMVGENNFLWLLFIYLIGGYINLYVKNDKIFSNIFLGISMYLIAVLSSFFFQQLGKYYYVFDKYQFYFSKQYSIFLLLASIFIFLGFRNIKFKSKNINLIASTMMGVYLIHDNYLLRKVLYFNILKNDLYINSHYFVYRIIITICIIFIVSVVLTLIYHYIFNKMFNKIYNKMKNKIKYSNKIQKLTKKVNCYFNLLEE